MKKKVKISIALLLDFINNDDFNGLVQDCSNSSA